MSLTYTILHDPGINTPQQTDSVTHLTVNVPQGDQAYMDFLAAGGVPAQIDGPHRTALKVIATAAAADTLTPAQIQLAISHMCIVMLNNM